MSERPHDAHGSPPGAGLFLVCLVSSAGLMTIGWHHTILDGDHGFRQTQTAITSYYLLAHGPSLAYETPVLGPPWSVPFEFPLYQALVAGTSTSLHAPLDASGRLVSVVFFLLTLVPVSCLLKCLGLEKEGRFLVLALLLASPFYIFWSRTFLMESTALFLSLAYLAGVLNDVRRPRSYLLLLGTLCGCLAAMVKITTFAVAFVVVLGLGLCWCWNRVRGNGHGASRRREAVGLSLAVLLPLSAGVAWTHFSDGLKELNPLGRSMTSAALWEWNFGTFAQRCRMETWTKIFGRADLLIGHWSVILVCALVVLMTGRRRREFAMCLLAYASGPLIFTNLYYVHEYYAYANGLFLIGAVGVAILALFESGESQRRVAVYLLALVLCLDAFRYLHEFYPKQRQNNVHLLEATRAIQQVTHPEDIIVVLGCDWSSEIPYYSERRALMVPESQRATLAAPETWLEPLAGYRVGAFVVRQGTQGDVDRLAVEHVARRLGLGNRREVSGGLFQIYAVPERTGSKEKGELGRRAELGDPVRVSTSSR